ncbi:MAG TPA: CHRD domain-containing protein [Puia sp.]|nr:CHRD domain-containing protein [Puia sp.]
MKVILTKTENGNGLLIALSIFIILPFMVSCGKGSANTSGNNPSNNVTYVGTFMKMDSTTTSATGTYTGVFDKTTLQMTYSFSWHSLSSTPIAMHFHDNGPVIISITGFPAATTQTMAGTATFTSVQAQDLASGYVFVMIHTANYPGGEIMAPLVKQ